MVNSWSNIREISVSHFFEDILAVAGELESRRDVRFVFVGGGTRFKEVERFVKEKNLSNVLLAPYCERSALAQSLSVGMSITSHFAPALKARRPEQGVRHHGRRAPHDLPGKRKRGNRPDGRARGIGHVVSPGDREGLRKAILDLCRDKDARDRMGRNARATLEEKYSPRQVWAVSEGLDGHPLRIVVNRVHRLHRSSLVPALAVEGHLVTGITEPGSTIPGASAVSVAGDIVSGAGSPLRWRGPTEWST